MNELTFKTIKVSGIETKTYEGSTKYILLDGKDKYGFYDKKKDGGNTTAYEQFMKLGLMIGQEIPVAVKEEEKDFVPTDGKNKGQKVTYLQRSIMYFPTKEEEAREAYSNASPSKEEGTSLSILENKVNVLTEKVNQLELTVLRLTQPQGENQDPEVKIEDVPF